MPDGNGNEGGEPTRVFSRMFDLDRTTLTRSMVERMEQCMREMDAARDDLKEVLAECREREFRAHDIAAMKKIAKLRKDDKRADASEQLAALERVGRAIGFDLFDWATASQPPA